MILLIGSMNECTCVACCASSGPPICITSPGAMKKAEFVYGACAWNPNFVAISGMGALNFVAILGHDAPNFVAISGQDIAGI